MNSPRRRSRATSSQEDSSPPPSQSSVLSMSSSPSRRGKRAKERKSLCSSSTSSNVRSRTSLEGSVASNTNLAAPSFTLPDDFFRNRQRYELWSVRVPASLEEILLSLGSENEEDALGEGFTLIPHGDLVPRQDDEREATLTREKKRRRLPSKPGDTLATLSRHVENGESIPTNEEPTTPTLRHGKRATKKPPKPQECALVQGHGVETERWRLLVRKETTENDQDTQGGDDDDNKEEEMVAVPSRFDRHVNLVLASTTAESIVADATLAPSVEQAPIPTPKNLTPRQFQTNPATTAGRNGVLTELRWAYSPVPMATGLKRRWAPMGAAGGAEAFEAAAAKAAAQRKGPATNARSRAGSTASLSVASASSVPPRAAPQNQPIKTELSEVATTKETKRKRVQEEPDPKEERRIAKEEKRKRKEERRKAREEKRQRKEKRKKMKREIDDA